jgi:hypothetical protein
VGDMATGDEHDPGQYEIRVEGHLDQHWSAWFDGLSLTRSSDGSTVIRGAVVDQAALHGLLQKVRDVGLPLISVVRVPLDGSTAAPAPVRPDLPRRPA